MNSLRKILGDNADIALVVMVVGILLVLFAPIPTILLDFLLVTNFCFAMLILLLTFYTEKPVQFSTFPSLLLIATLFRLSLNISATRLILSDADAGKVIGAVGSYVVGGNYVIGLIVFLILVVVQYVVVTSGAQRVAEVAARFTLDSMPGQQMSIDADLNMGFIGQDEAKRRRKELEREASFYGSMDGASKFVKGDAVAGIIILLINIVGGLVIGITQLGMKWTEAIQTFALLTIGDGIVTQVPALIIATGTGIIITRSSSDSNLSTNILRQMTMFPKILVLIMFALSGLVFLPGMPMIPIVVVGAIIGLIYFVVSRDKTSREDAKEASTESAKNDIELIDALVIEPIQLEIGANLIPLVNTDESSFPSRIGAFRKQYAQDSGVIIPHVQVRDSQKLSPNSYEIQIYGVRIAHGDLMPDQHLAIHPSGEKKNLKGTETKDPTYGLPAVWIGEESQEVARQSGYTLVDPTTVLMTHLSETIRQQAASLLTRSETEILVNRIRTKQAGLIDELVPAILTLSEIQKIFQQLLREKVSIRNIEAILEVLVDAGRQNKDADVLTELVRAKLGPVICQSLVGSNGYINVITFDPSVEQVLSGSFRNVDLKSILVLEPKFAEQLISKTAAQVEKMMKSNLLPVLLCSPDQRRHVRRVTERILPHLAILSFTEVPSSFNLKGFAVVNV